MTTQEFIFNVPLYTKIDISEDDQILMDLCAYELRVDGYNPIVGVDFPVDTMVQNKKALEAIPDGMLTFSLNEDENGVVGRSPQKIF